MNDLLWLVNQPLWGNIVGILTSRTRYTRGTRESVLCRNSQNIGRASALDRTRSQKTPSNPNGFRQSFGTWATPRMIWSGNPVINSNFWESYPECSINEVWSSITGDYSWDSIPREDDLVEQLLWVHSIGSPTRKSFYPFRDIVNGNQDVLATFWVREWPHEINSLDIEDINLEIQSQWHCFPCIDISMPLTLAATSNKWLGVTIHGGPVETTLPHHSIGAESSIVSPIWWWMTMLKYLACLKSRYASS
jgi:hypothetical protein